MKIEIPDLTREKIRDIMGYQDKVVITDSMLIELNKLVGEWLSGDGGVLNLNHLNMGVRNSMWRIKW